MDKIKEKKISWFMIFVSTLAVIMFLLPFSAVVVEGVFCIEMAASLLILILLCLNQYMILPKIIQFFTICSITVNITLTISLLKGLFTDNQIPLVSFLADHCCANNFYWGLMLIYIMLIFTVFLVKKIINISEKSVNSEQTSIIIRVSKQLIRSIKSIIFMTLLSMIAGIIIEEIQRLSLKEAFAPVVMYTTGNVILYIVPLIIVTIATRLCIRKIVKMKSSY